MDLFCHFLGFVEVMVLLNMPKLFTKTKLTVSHDKQNLRVVNDSAKPNVNQAVNQRVSESNEDRSNPQHGILHIFKGICN